MRKSGKTPLLRAKKLENELNVGEIYIKLEGTNPSGHKYDRITEVLIKDAIKHNYKKLLVNGTEKYIRSVLFFAELEELEIAIPLFKNEKWKNSKFKDYSLLDFRNTKDIHPRVLLIEYAQTNHLYLIDEGSSNTIISNLALQEVTFECLNKLSFKVNTIFTQLGYGYTLASIYGAILKSWVDENLEKLPQLFYGTFSDGNNILEYYKKNMSISNKELDSFERTESPLTLSQYDKDLLEVCFKAVLETEGEMVYINEDELKSSVKLLKKYENILISNNEAYPIASFIKKATSGELSSGKHIIILNDAKSEVDIRQIYNFDNLSMEYLTKLTRDFLSMYSDSKIETSEAIEHAIKSGYLLIASRNGQYQGICVVVNLGFEKYIPTYHLSYIGVKSGNKGRGVATELIKKAIDLTDGKISLHVDLDNKGAKKLYEKLGFRHMYNRMIYKDNY